MSPTGQSETVVAQVVLKPASGLEITGYAPITSETLPQYLPDPGDADAVARVLAAAGFEVGPVAGIGMSAAGPLSLFEEYFGAKVERDDTGGWVAVGSSGAPSRELPVDALPDSVSSRVHAVSFEEPVEPVVTP